MAKANSAASIHAKRGRSTPAQIRARHEAGTTHGDERAFVRVGKTATKVLSGEDDLSDWDDEELRRGRRRVNKPGSKYHGQFQGSDPIVVPKALHDELVKRTLDEASRLLQKNLMAAVTALVDIVTDESAEPRDRLRAIQMVTDRVMGKAPEKVELSGGEAPWQVALLNGIVSSNGKDKES